MRNLLSDGDIYLMRKELDAKPYILAPIGREFWSVHRIVDTLEYFKDIEEKYNKLLNSNLEKQVGGLYKF